MWIIDFVTSLFSSKKPFKKYSWVRDLPDYRDFKYSPTVSGTSLPVSVDLRNTCPPVLDQGQLGSCTANSIANAFYFDELKQKESSAFLPSRLFIYYNERVLEGTVKQDSGAQIRDGFKTIATQGVVSEKSWSYIISKFKTKPSATLYKNALKTKAISYHSVAQNLIDMKSCLSEGFPIVIGFSVYSSFESNSVAQSGIVPMPSKSEQLLGGHAVLVVGYDDNTQRFLVQNSWGTSWGQSGFFTIPYAYLTNPNLASDFWTLRTVS